MNKNFKSKILDSQYSLNESVKYTVHTHSLSIQLYYFKIHYRTITINNNKKWYISIIWAIVCWLGSSSCQGIFVLLTFVFIVFSFVCFSYNFFFFQYVLTSRVERFSPFERFSKTGTMLPIRHILMSTLKIGEFSPARKIRPRAG